MESLPRRASQASGVLCFDGATSTDHGHQTAQTANLPVVEAEDLFAHVKQPHVSPEDAELFRAQMLNEMAGMSVEDGFDCESAVRSRWSKGKRLGAKRSRPSSASQNFE